ncbi:MAG: sigma-70 family RNA polymerase sigma factor [Thermoleophilaceae bacterium]
MTAPAVAAPTRTHASISDGDLVALVRDGDDGAFEELYRRHHAHVTGVVARMLRDPARTEDVVQETFLSALRRLRETDTEMRFRAWISEIARNATIDQFRRAGRAKEVSIDADQGLPPVDALRLAGGPSPEVSAIGRERFGHFRGALDELSVAHQRVIVLRELEGHSYREIGQLMDLTPSGVESTLFRARRRLEQEYEQIDSGVRCVATEAAIGRLCEGSGSWRDRRKLHRHASRCSMCRRHARECGIEPLLPGSGIGTKVAALLPFPIFFSHRRTGMGEPIRSVLETGSRQSQALAPAAGSAWEQSAPLIGKTLAVIAAATVIGHSPAADDARRDAKPPGPVVTRGAQVTQPPGPAASTPAPRVAPASEARARMAPERPRRARRPRFTAPPRSRPRAATPARTGPPAAPGATSGPRASLPSAPAPREAVVVEQASSVPAGDVVTRGAAVSVPAAPVRAAVDVANGVAPATRPVTDAVTGPAGA